MPDKPERYARGPDRLSNHLSFCAVVGDAPTSPGKLIDSDVTNSTGPAGHLQGASSYRILQEAKCLTSLHRGSVWRLPGMFWSREPRMPHISPSFGEMWGIDCACSGRIERYSARLIYVQMPQRGRAQIPKLAA
jgi:hypothetical protein